MRKISAAALVLIIVIAIALLVRSQQGEEPTARTRIASAQPPHDSQRVQPEAAPIAMGKPKPASVITTVSNSVQKIPQQSAERRPVASANTDVADGPTVPLASEIVQEGAAVLKRTSAAYAKVKSMQADFVQRRENPLLNSTNTSRGKLYQKNPDRIALKFSQPAGDIIVGDGRYFWVYYPSADKRQVLRADASAGGAGAVDLQAQFIGDPVRRFKYTYEGAQKLNGRNVHVLTLVPRQEAGYKSMKVWIDATDSLVRRFQITEPTGVLVEFHLSNLKVNPSLSNDIFKFTPPPGAQVIER